MYLLHGKNITCGYDTVDILTECTVGVKKGEKKLVEAVLPANHPKKELANKNTKFECQILDVKRPLETKIDDDFAKLMGAKDISDFATSCIDISDGLIKDLGDICKQSNVGAELIFEDIPILNDHKDLTHGDDYQLCFTAPSHLDDQLRSQGFFFIGKIIIY